MPNTPELPAPGRQVSPMLREMALVAHALPSAELDLELHDGRRFSVGARPRDLMTTCLLRRAVADAVSGVEVAWLGSIRRAELTSIQCRDLGTGLYGAWCNGRPVYAFSTELPVELLEAVFDSLPDNEETTVRLRADRALSLSLVAVEPRRCRHDAIAQAVAREIQATILVEELTATITSTETR